MANRAVKERLAQDVSLWLTDGLISKPTHDLLRQRYGAGGYGLGQAIKSLGVAGALIAFLGLLGLVGALSRSELFAAFLLLGTGCGLTAGGIYLSVDRLGRYPASSKAVLMLGVVSAALGVGVGVSALGIRNQAILFWTGALILIPVAILAYRYRNTFLLVIGLIGFFHWVGAWNSMFGRSTYAVAVEDPRVMSVVALGAVALGVYHERVLKNHTGRFFQAYETLGLIYLNLSLLIMGIHHNRLWGNPEVWVLVFTGVAIAQIVAGARLHNPLLTGFGVTAFAVDLFTRYYENFWDRLLLGEFLLIGGLALFAAGLACEVLLRRLQRRPA
jgi:hypothetical protein